MKTLSKKQRGIEQIMSFIEAENEAFENAEIEVGEVEFTCPICGGQAVGNRYWHGGRIHGLGSGCKGCGIWHS